MSEQRTERTPFRDDPWGYVKAWGCLLFGALIVASCVGGLYVNACTETEEEKAASEEHLRRSGLFQRAEHEARVALREKFPNHVPQLDNPQSPKEGPPEGLEGEGIRWHFRMQYVLSPFSSRSKVDPHHSVLVYVCEYPHGSSEMIAVIARTETLYLGDKE